MIIDENFNVCEIGNFCNKIKGIASNSASPSDTWVVYFKEDVKYKYNDTKSEKLSSGFLKIFLNTENLKDKSDKKVALEYELEVYKILKDITKYKISPNFLEYLGCGEKCTYSDLFKILYGNLYNSSDTDFMNRLNCINNLNRNLYYILQEKRKRPAIQNDTLVITGNIDFSIKPFKYNIIMTKNMENNITLTKWLNLYKDTNLIELWNILFQVASACYVMSLSQIVHNDLHTGNIFVHDLGTETNFRFHINEMSTVIKTRYQIMIYDFDRVYASKLGNNPININYCQNYSQCNFLIPNKDIIKLLCYVHKNVSTKMKENILNILSSDELFKNRIHNTYVLRSEKDGFKNCFLQYVDRIGNIQKSIPNEWYSNFYDNFQIIQKIQEHLPNLSSELVSDENIYRYASNIFDINGQIIFEKVEIETEIEENESELNLEDLEDLDLELEDILNAERTGLFGSFPKEEISLSSPKEKISETTIFYKKLKKLQEESRLLVGDLS